MTRIDYFTEKPELITKLRHITREQENFTLAGRLRALVELRVSQMNGCPYCNGLHTREARLLGSQSVGQYRTRTVKNIALSWTEPFPICQTEILYH